MDNNGHSEPPSILPREMTEFANGRPSGGKLNSFIIISFITYLHF
jgi:hypothetical protein